VVGFTTGSRGVPGKKENLWQKMIIIIIIIIIKAKPVPLHATEAIGGRGGIAPHS
jgi:hypothetical protein